jgi:hypothetical protein
MYSSKRISGADMADFVRLDETDNVVTVTRTIEAGTQIDGVQTKIMTPRGHKIATQDIPTGQVPKMIKVDMSMAQI